jgi:hypothetical protein
MNAVEEMLDAAYVKHALYDPVDAMKHDAIGDPGH